MPIPHGEITTSEVWVKPAEEITEKFPPNEETEVIIEVEDDEDA